MGDRWEELLLSFGGMCVAESNYPPGFLDNGVLFLPQQVSFHRHGRTFSFTEVGDNLPGVHCSVLCVPGPAGQCFDNAIDRHAATSEELCIGFALVEGVWLSHAWNYQPDTKTLVEASWRHPGRLYFGSIGRFDT